MQQEELADTIATIYEAALDFDVWPTAIDNLRHYLDGVGGVVFCLNHDVGQIESWHHCELNDDDDEYARRLHQINPRVDVSLGEPAGRLCWDYRFIREEDIDRHEFYDGIQRLSGVRYFIGSRVVEFDNRSILTSIERTKKQGHVQPEDIELFGLIAPHIGNAYQLGLKHFRRRRRNEFLEQWFEESAEGVAFLNTLGEVTYLNAAAAFILRERDGVWLEDRQVRLWKAADNRRLKSLVGGVLDTANGESFGAGGMLSLNRPSGRLPYLIRVTPWILSDHCVSEEQPAAILHIKDPEISIPIDAQSLTSFFGLSPREAELARHLAAGQSLRSASQAIGISYNTARVHLHHIFLKTGVTDQNNLIRLLLSLPSNGSAAR